VLNVSDLIQYGRRAWVNSRLLVGQSSNCSEDGVSRAWRERWKVSQGYASVPRTP